jgi:hypothetical protein
VLTEAGTITIEGFSGFWKCRNEGGPPEGAWPKDGTHALGGDGGWLGLLSSSERAVMSPLWQYAPLAGLSWQPGFRGAAFQRAAEEAHCADPVDRLATAYLSLRDAM